MGDIAMSAPADVPAAVRTFRTQLAAVAWLQASGYRVSKSLFSQHVRKGLIACNAAGLFEVPALLGYAAVNLTPTARIEDAQAQAAAVGRLSADADWRAVKAERERIKLQKESGLVMPVRAHEDELAARAVFFKAEIEGFIHRAGPRIIDLVHGNPDSLQELIIWWTDATADWMDAWSREREFVTGDRDDIEPGVPTEEL